MRRTDLLSARVMLIDVVFRVQEILGLRNRRIEFDPPFVHRQTHAVRTNPRLDQPVRHRINRVVGWFEEVDDLFGGVMFSVRWRLGVGDGHEHVVELVEIALSETEAHGEDAVGLETTRLHPVDGLVGALFVQDISSARARDSGDDGDENSEDAEGTHALHRTGSQCVELRRQLPSLYTSIMSSMCYTGSTHGKNSNNWTNGANSRQMLK